MGLLEDLVSWLFFFKWSRTNRNHFKQIGFVFHLFVFIVIFCFVYLFLTIQVIWIWVVFQLGGWLVFNMCNTPGIDMMVLFFPSFSNGYQGSFSLDSVMIEEGWWLIDVVDFGFPGSYNSVLRSSTPRESWARLKRIAFTLFTKSSDSEVYWVLFLLRSLHLHLHLSLIIPIITENNFPFEKSVIP